VAGKRCAWCGMAGGSPHGEGICNGPIHELSTKTLDLGGAGLHCRPNHPITLPVRVTTVMALVTCAECIALWPEPLRAQMEAARHAR
jgi:hypothetical protein